MKVIGPIYRDKDNSWYYDLNGHIYGPFETEVEAIRHLAKQQRCPSCEE